MLQAPCGSAGLYAAPASARRCTANSDFKAQQHGARGEKRPSSRLGRRLETQSTGLGGLRVLRRRSGACPRVCFASCFPRSTGALSQRVRVMSRAGLRIVRAAHEGNGNGNGNGNGSKTRQNVGSGCAPDTLAAAPDATISCYDVMLRAATSAGAPARVTVPNSCRGNFFDGEKEKKKEALLLRLFENMFGFVFSEHDHKELEGGNREASPGNSAGPHLPTHHAQL